MNWHSRYTQQARWTRELRKYIFDKTGLKNAQRVLEVGCGTGAVLAEVHTSASLHGLDLQSASLIEAQIHAPSASLACGDALSLPYADQSFDFTFCHFLLLWVMDPLQALAEMKRVTRHGGYLLALAEPDYSARTDKPAELAILGKWQTTALQHQGANPSFGGRLAESFYLAGIQIIETGAIQKSESEALNPAEQELEWAVLEADLVDSVSSEDIQKMKMLEAQAWERGERVLHVPTYFAWGKV